jgi:hypothetical protein
MFYDHYFFNFVLEYAIRKVHKKKKIGGTEIKWDTSHYGLYWYWFYWGKLKISQRKTKALSDASKEAGIEVNAEKTNYMLMSL